MKKIILSITVLLGAIAGGYFGYGQLAGAATSTINPFYCDTSSTSSVNLIGIAAVQGYTTSVDCVIPVKDWDTMTFFTQMNASTTGSTLSFKVYGTVDGIDYFDIPNVTTDSPIANTVGSTTVAFAYAPQVAGFNRTTFSFNPKGFNQVKVTTTAGTASSSVWQMVVPTSN